MCKAGDWNVGEGGVVVKADDVFILLVVILLKNDRCVLGCSLHPRGEKGGLRDS